MSNLMEWWLRGVVGGAFLLFVGWALLHTVSSPGRRERVGAWTVRAVVLMPLFALMPGWWNIEASPEPIHVVKAEPPPVIETIPEPIFVPVAWVQLTAVEPTPAIHAPISEPIAKPSISRILLMVYGGIAGLLLLRLFIGQLALWRLRRKSVVAPNEVKAILPDTDVRVCDRIEAPICFGLFRPIVLLPNSIALDDSHALGWVLRHENDHLRRGDPWTCWYLGVAHALYFFVPWMRWFQRDVRLAQEYLADAAAVGEPSPVGKLEYAEFLIRLSRRLGGPTMVLSGATGVKAGSSDLFRRVSMLLEETEGMKSRPSRSWSLMIAVGFLGLSLMVAGLSVRAQDAPKIVVESIPANKVAPAVLPKQNVIVVQPFNPGVDIVQDELARLKEQLKDVPGADEMLQQMEEMQKQMKALQRRMPMRAQIQVQGQNLNPIPFQFQIPNLGNVGGVGFGGGLPGFQPAQIMPFNPGMQPGFGANPFMPVAQEGRFGMRIEKPTPVLADQLDLPVGQGMVVSQVINDSAAAKAGIKANDILLEVDGKAVPNDPADFMRRVGEIKADQAIDVLVLRKGRKETIKGLKLPEAQKVDHFIPAQPFGFQPLQPMAIPVPPILNPKVNNLVPMAIAPIPPLPGGNQESMSISIQNNSFTSTYMKNKLTITITGDIDGGKSTVTEIVITDGDKKITAATAKEVPTEYQDAVKKAMSGLPNR